LRECSPIPRPSCESARAGTRSDQSRRGNISLWRDSSSPEITLTQRARSPNRKFLLVSPSQTPSIDPAALSRLALCPNQTDSQHNHTDRQHERSHIQRPNPLIRAIRRERHRKKEPQPCRIVGTVTKRMPDISLASRFIFSSCVPARRAGRGRSSVRSSRRTVRSEPEVYFLTKIM
jgi:hypothetical protein